MIKCYKCNKELTETEPKYLIHIIEPTGDKVFVHVCSEDCRLNAIEENATLHFKRYIDVEKQSVQRIR